jgi:hypothetical protein
MAGRGGRCYAHAGLSRTDAQREATKKNRKTSGLYINGFLNDDERAVHDEALTGEVEKVTLQREALAASRVRLVRLLAWESKEGKTSRDTPRAFEQFTRALRETPESAEKPFNPLEEAALIKQMNDLLREHPELFIEGYPPPVQAAILKVIREGGAPPPPPT